MSDNDPQSVVDLHVRMLSTALEDLSSVVTSIKLHDQSCLVFLEVFDACMKTRHQRDVTLVQLWRLLWRWSRRLQQYNYKYLLSDTAWKYTE